MKITIRKWISVEILGIFKNFINPELPADIDLPIAYLI